MGLLVITIEPHQICLHFQSPPTFSPSVYSHAGAHIGTSGDFGLPSDLQSGWRSACFRLLLLPRSACGRPPEIVPRSCADTVSRSELSSRKPWRREKSLVLPFCRSTLPRVPPSREKADKGAKIEPCGVLRCLLSFRFPLSRWFSPSVALSRSRLYENTPRKAKRR